MQTLRACRVRGFLPHPPSLPGHVAKGAARGEFWGTKPPLFKSIRFTNNEFRRCTFHNNENVRSRNCVTAQILVVFATCASSAKSNFSEDCFRIPLRRVKRLSKESPQGFRIRSAMMQPRTIIRENVCEKSSK